MFQGNADPQTLLKIIQTQTEIAKSGLDLGGVMSFVADRVQHLTHATGAIVELAEGNEMVYRAAVGMARSQLGLRLQRQGSLSGLCVEQGRALRCDDAELDDRVDREACRKVGLRSMVVVPLSHEGISVGVLKIASPSANAFTEQHVLILELMSDLIAAAMFQAVKYGTHELYHQATHDSMTGLANRALFYDRLRQCLSLAHRRALQIAVLNLDMDGLKPINDRHGHRVGDEAIRETARRIKKTSRESDTVARLGGDEFAVILSDVRGRDGTKRFVERMERVVSQPFVFEGKSLSLHTSVGAAIFPEDGTEIDALLHAADQSMYHLKRGRKKAQVITMPGVAV